MPESAINQKNATGFLAILIPAALALSALYEAWPYILGAVLLTIGFRLFSDYQWSKMVQSINPDFQRLIVQNRGEITPMDLAIVANISGQEAQRYLSDKASEFGTGSRQHPERGQVYYFISVRTLGDIFDDSEREVLEIAPAVTSPVVFRSNSPVSAVETETPLQLVPVEVSLVVEPPPAIEYPIVESVALNPPPATPIIEAISANPPPETEIPIVEVAATEPTSLSQILAAEAQHSEPSVTGKLPTNQPLVTIIQSELAKRLDVHSSTVYKRRSEPNFTDWTRNRDPEGLAWGYAEDTKEYYQVDV